METVRRAAGALIVPLVAAAGLVPAAVVPAAVADPGQPAGGAQLGGHGVVVNRSAGVPPLPKIDASSFVIADADTGQVLAARDAHGRYLPASTLKVLTAVTLIPKLDASATMRPTQRTCDVEGTKVGMTPSMRYRISDLFKAAIMVSGNDAALALAQANGGVRPTVAAMNTEAKRLHADDTLAGSPNGLDVDLGLNIKTQHTSAYDLALFMKQGLKLPDFQTYVGTVNAHFPAPPTKAQRKKGKKVGGYPIYTHDRLIRPGTRYPGMIGGKNGYTVAAMQTFVGAARRNGHTIIVSLMHSPTSFWYYVPKMLDWGFAATGKVKPAGTLVDPVPADSAKKEAARDGGSLPIALPASAKDVGPWLLVGGGSAGTVVLLLGLTVVVRRRRRGRSDTSAAGSAAETPGATGTAVAADTGIAEPAEAAEPAQAAELAGDDDHDESVRIIPSNGTGTGGSGSGSGGNGGGPSGIPGPWPPPPPSGNRPTEHA